MPLSDLVTQVKPAAKDSRRVIYELSIPKLVKISPGFVVGRPQSFAITNSDPLGNHYHLEAEEFFLITSGLAIHLFLENIETKERFDTTLKEGDLVHVPPKIAHAFRFTEGQGSMMGIVSTPAFDQVDMPTYTIMAPNGDPVSPPAT